MSNINKILYFIVISILFIPMTIKAQGGRYMNNSKNCVNVLEDSELGRLEEIRPYIAAAKSKYDQSADSWPIKECVYTYGTAIKPENIYRGWVVLADPPMDVVDRWKVNACEKAIASLKIQDDKRLLEKCFKRLDDSIKASNGHQFPIMGFVSEGKENCRNNGKEENQEGLFAFRHGVTVQYSGLKSNVTPTSGWYCNTASIDPVIQKKWAIEVPVDQIFHLLRYSTLSDKCVAEQLGISSKVQLKNSVAFERKWFLELSQLNHIRAIKEDRDDFLEIAAQHLMGDKSLSPSCILH